MKRKLARQNKLKTDIKPIDVNKIEIDGFRVVNKMTDLVLYYPIRDYLHAEPIIKEGKKFYSLISKNDQCFFSLIESLSGFKAARSVYNYMRNRYITTQLENIRPVLNYIQNIYPEIEIRGFNTNDGQKIHLYIHFIDQLKIRSLNFNYLIKLIKKINVGKIVGSDDDSSESNYNTEEEDPETNIS